MVMGQRRLAAVMMIAAGALAAWADGGPTPGGGGTIQGMKCQSQPSNCTSTTQAQDCVGKSSGAGCTFCDGGNWFKTCVSSGNGCVTSGNDGCGAKISGTCLGNPLNCQGNQVLDPSCSLVKCQ
ncbi:MAG: hypothetical protein DPW13_01735 [Planctomycetes bacterium]|nr:hypothetical protein [Planctomycetota bacterium]